MNDAPRRAVVLAPNWLGDAVMALPAIADLRRAWPGAHLAVAARPAVAPLFAMVPGVDETIVLETGGGLSTLVGWTRDAAAVAVGRFDLAVVLPNSFAVALTAWRAGVPIRCGFATDRRARLLTHAVPKPKAPLHQAAYYQALVAGIGCGVGPMHAHVHVSEATRARAHQVLAAAGVPAGAGVVVLAPGAAYGRAKQWLPERFAELAARIDVERDLVPVLVGSRGDGAVCARIAEEAALEIARRMAPRADAAPVRLDSQPPEHARPPAIVNIAGRTDLATAAGLMAIADACVSNDSGAMHLAAAVGARVVAIFGPTNERATWPIGPEGWPGATLVTAEAWCRPCMLRECPIDHRCMARVTVESVLEHL